MRKENGQVMSVFGLTTLGVADAAQQHIDAGIEECTLFAGWWVSGVPVLTTSDKLI